MRLVVAGVGTIPSVQQTFVDGRYVVERLLGRGGMAQVYLTHDKVLDRHVALKILREQYAEDEEFIQRFWREARSAASLSHSNIVSIYDQGRSEDGEYYIAMEYVPGGTLKERMRREGVFTPDAAVRVALQITDALSEAHEKGVIHRDIKPQNVLLSHKGDVKVTDFGIARAAASASSVATATGAVLGTAAYMSPEQARGEPVGPQSDLYSLGVVLYEMLTGTVPYEAESPIAQAMMHISEPPRSPRQVNRKVPEPLDALTLKLLAKDPEDRYPRAAALANDLERVRAGLPLAGVDAKTTAQMAAPPPPLSVASEGRTAKTTVRPPVTAPVGTPGGRSARGRSGLRNALAALLFGLVLLAPLAFALGLFEGFDATGSGGDEDPSSTEDAANFVQVPALYWSTTAQTDLAAVGLKLGRQYETPSETIPVGVVSEQDPEEGAEVEEGTAVDTVVSTGLPRQAPVAPVNDEKEREKQQQEAEKQREKQQQEAEKQREKQQQEEEKRKERGD
jgi:eukaryotic-like serine/threonine-protein kinase